MALDEVAKKIDYTILKTEASEAEILEFLNQAKEHSFRAVCIHSFYVALAKERLADTKILVAAVVDFPFGQGGIVNKRFQAELARDEGANEIDVVMNVGALKSKNYDIVLEELKSVCSVLPTKVIIESGLLTDEEILKSAELVQEAGAEFIKTSTGFISNTDIGTKSRHIKLIRDNFPKLKIKASGGIKTLEDFNKVLAAGANIVGASGGAITIINSLKS